MKTHYQRSAVRGKRALAQAAGEGRLWPVDQLTRLPIGRWAPKAYQAHGAEVIR
jgi:hypothetical protein